MKYSLILVLSLIILTACGTYTGYASREFTGARQIATTSCQDSDDGINSDVYGKVQFRGRTYSDSCFDAGRVREYYCNGRRARGKIVGCGTNECVNGVCVEPTQESACYDSDGGADILTQGIVVYRENQYEDVCLTSSSIREYTCSNQRARYKDIDCPYNYECVEGACFKMNSCYDSDGGLNPDVRGYVNATVNGTWTYHVDSCEDSSTLNEWECLGDYPNLEQLTCELGFRCLEGICVEDMIPDDMHLDDYPHPFVAIDNTSLNAILVIGQSASASDAVAATYLVASLQAYIAPYGGQIPVDAVKLDSEVADAFGQNTITIGNPCVNSITASWLGNPPDCTAGFQASIGRLKFMSHDPVYGLMVAGYTDQDTLNAAVVLAEYYSYEFPSDEMWVEEVWNGWTVYPAPGENSCVDSDGDNRNTWGFVNATLNGTLGYYPDECKNYTQVYEQICVGDYHETVERSCIFGSVCQDGKCTQPPQNSCTDSDGDNRNTFGFVNATVNGNQEYHEDTCKNTTQVYEQLCDGDSHYTEERICLGQEVCENGKCAIPAPQHTCFDSDGDNPNVFGNVSGLTYGYYYINYDTCVGTGQVKEFYCDGPTNRSHLIVCGIGKECVNGACVNQACIDSDGDDRNTFGHVNATVNNTPVYYEDVCKNTTQVYEQLCNGDTHHTEERSCLGGRNCENGRCALPSQYSCTDSDGGYNIEEYGVVNATISGMNFIREDYCNGNTLHEFGCYPEINSIHQWQVSCPSGICLEGECTIPVNCVPGQIIGDVNNDGVIDNTDRELIQPLISTGDGWPEDLCCVDVDQNGQVGSGDYLWIGAIMNGLKESPGICGIAPDSCYDSDGDNRNTFGFVNATVNGNQEYHEDTCKNTTQVYEQLCNGDTHHTEERSCLGGTNCQNGKCTQAMGTWTQWFDRDKPSGTGDWEHINALPVCNPAIDVECQTISGLPASSTGQTITCSTTVGMVCQNKDNPTGCQDYKVRFLCP